MADWAVQLQFNSHTLTGSAHFHSLSSRSWRGVFMEAESPSGGMIAEEVVDEIRAGMLVIFS